MNIFGNFFFMPGGAAPSSLLIDGPETGSGTDPSSGAGTVGTEERRYGRVVAFFKRW